MNKLFILLQDNKPHSTIDICKEVYGDEHLGLSRVGARIFDLKKKYGLNIESWRDKKRKTIWWYRLVSGGNQSGVLKESANETSADSWHIPVPDSPQKLAEQPSLIDVKY